MYMFQGINIITISQGSRFRGLLESASWNCVCAQIKDGSDVVTSWGFRPYPRECIYDSGSIMSLSIGPDYQYHAHN